MRLEKCGVFFRKCLKFELNFYHCVAVGEKNNTKFVPQVYREKKIAEQRKNASRKGFSSFRKALEETLQYCQTQHYHSIVFIQQMENYFHENSTHISASAHIYRDIIWSYYKHCVKIVENLRFVRKWIDKYIQMEYNNISCDHTDAIHHFKRRLLCHSIR